MRCKQGRWVKKIRKYGMIGAIVYLNNKHKTQMDTFLRPERNSAMKTFHQNIKDYCYQICLQHI